jgi:predicted ATPase
MIKFTIANFRGFENEQTIELGNQVLVVTGQNNTGKSNILRAFALIFNEYSEKDFIVPMHDFHDERKGGIELGLHIAIDDLRLSAHPVFRAPYIRNWVEDNSGVRVPFKIQRDGLNLDISSLVSELEKIIPHREDQDVLRNYAGSWSSNREHNLRSMASHMDIRAHRGVGTVYIPAFRHITRPGEPLPSYNDIRLPGQTLDAQNVVAVLQQLDRPPAGKLADKLKLRDIERFLSFCLEAETAIEVASDRSAIYVQVNGVPYDLRTLGSGIEQLIIIGTGALAFGNRIVLLEEPELHLHPRTQRRMINYFQENHVDNKIVVTTHSAAIVDTPKANVIHVQRKERTSSLSAIRVETEMFALIDDLGYKPSDLVQSNFIVWVEGPSDRIYVNHWLSQAASELRERIDYSVLFYGGRLLSHLSFETDVDALINILSINKNAAIIIDSDKRNNLSKLNSTKIRIKRECEKAGLFAWVTRGREIENYIDPQLRRQLLKEWPELNANEDDFQPIIPKNSRINKVHLAISVTAHRTDFSHLKLETSVSELAKRIESVKARATRTIT